MNKWVRLGAISAISLGIFAFGYGYVGNNVRVSAAEQFYSVPNANSNIQQENNTSNAMSSYADNSLQTVATTPPSVAAPSKYVHTSLDMNSQNKADSYTSQDGSTTFNTYYYLPEGFHVKSTEHGNYQSSVQVGDNIYVVESMGTGTNQGAIVRYNVNDLQQLGVLNPDGSGIDTVWKALKYISPYTQSGNNHSSQYANYQSYLDDANSQLQNTKNQVQNAQDQLASDQQEVDDYQTELDKSTKAGNQQIAKIQSQLNTAYKAAKKADKNTPMPKPAKLTLDNFVDTMKSANSVYDDRLNKLAADEQQVRQSMSDLKAALKGKAPKSLAVSSSAAAAKAGSSASASVSDTDSDASADSSSSASSASASSDDTKATSASATDKSSVKDSTTDSKANAKTKVKKISKQEYQKQMLPLTKKLTKITNQKNDIKSKRAVNSKYLAQYLNGFGKKWNTDTTNVNDAKDLIVQDQQAITDANQAVVNAQKAIDQLSQNQVDFAKYSAIAHAAQISPLINIGHGQTLSYNPVTKNLYLAQDETSGDLPASGSNVITELDANTLQPIKQFNFQLMHNNVNYAIHTLTFDNDGNAYFGRKSGKNYQIFKGQLNETTGQVNFAPVPQKIKWGGTHNQGLTYNPVNNRLYIVSDDIITSVPADKLSAGTVQPSDVNYISFNTGREFEDLTFDAQGYGYLLMLWKPEILKTTAPIK
ncbi:hypothetical protein MOO44_02835 [Nicoliella spurrieriana]|uniref:Uncharacterized protein n=1 Tax=Nicoliella spurrieriana TaxID=2925830 RepID=A0A976RSS2_9LACO|nr:hypothetical protein [Nicoliella spurrieriana]UQS87114.1 hypothetical protein MOO44_02835 [Nicoliella spurrieriana]